MEGVCMKNLNQLIKDYTCLLQQGEIQIAYKNILEFLGKLRAAFVKRYPNYDTSNIYQGYMDMSYFSINTQLLKEKGLKIALVYLHNKGNFEVWLSPRNRTIGKQYESLFSQKNFDSIKVFHDDENKDAIIEYTVISSPNFEDHNNLIEIIEKGLLAFIEAVSKVFQLHVSKGDFV